MRLSALVHLSRAVLEMSDVERIVVFGSAALLASFPSLGEEEGSPIQMTFDADIIPFPFEEDLGEMLHEAFGDGRRKLLLSFRSAFDRTKHPVITQVEP